MTNKKLTVSLLTIASLISLNTFAQTPKQDVSVSDVNDNTRQQSVQEVINKELNAALPNTTESTALAPSIESRNAKNADGSNWGERTNNTFVHYVGKDADTGAEIHNCVWDNSNKACDTSAGKTINEQHKIVVPSTSTEENGFYVPSGEVVTNQGGTNQEQYFYRYWIADGQPEGKSVCADGLGSCWSPSFPIICLPGVSKTIAEDLKNMKATEAADYFGVRQIATDAIENGSNPIINGYAIMKDADDRMDYRMRVRVKADNMGGLVSVSGEPEEGEKNVSVASWRMNEQNGCLEPDFNIPELAVDGYTKTGVISNLDLEKNTGISDESLDASGNPTVQILPCGIFANAETKKISDYDKNVYNQTSTGEFFCKKDGYAFVTKSDVSGQYYTEYKISLPSAGSGELANEDNATYTKNLKVRGCGKCEVVARTNGVEGHCKHIIKGLIENGNIEGCTCVERGTSTHCSDSTPVFSRYYNCTNAGLSTLVHHLLSDSEFKLSNNMGVYNRALTCTICLNTLESDLKDILINHN